MTNRPRQWARRVPLAAVAGLALVSGCTAKPAAAPVHPVAVPPASAAPLADLEKAAPAALNLVQESVPSGYGAQPVVSGYDWSAHTGQAIKESLTGPHILQIACSGDGEMSAVVRAADKASTQHIACGQEVSVPFVGALDAVIDGRPGNTGVVAWRVLAHA